KTGEALEQALAMQAPRLVIVELDARNELLDVARAASMGGQKFHHRTRVEMNKHPADVEDDIADHVDSPSRHFVLPRAHAAGIDVYEIGTRIEPYTTALCRKCEIPEGGELDAMQTHIHRPTLHMHALFGDVMTACDEPGVGCRRAVSRNHFVTRLESGGARKIAE